MTTWRAWGILAGLAVLVLCSSAEAQLPKDGSFSGKFGWSASGAGHEIEKNHLFFLGEFNGTFFNDESAGFLDGSSWACPGVNDVVNGVTRAAHGYCIVTDQDGEKAFGSWTSTGTAPGRGAGEFKWTGGTGKYRGLTSGGTFEYVFVSTSMQGYSTIRGHWRLP